MLGSPEARGSLLGLAGLKRSRRAGLSTRSWHSLAPACFLFVKDKLWYQNLPKIPFSSHPRAGAWGVLSRATCRVGEPLRPALPSPILPPHSPTSPYFPLLCSRTRDLRCHPGGPAPSSCCRPITMVPMVTAPSPWLHTNRHGHSVAQPTASAVGHVKVRAISPPQAWGRVTWQEETPPPLLRWSQAPPPCCVGLKPPVQPSPSTVPCLEPEGMVLGDPRPEERTAALREVKLRSVLPV